MLIDFESYIQQVDEYSHNAFVEILNLILLSEDAAELERRLRFFDCDPKYRSLAGYYKWSFDNYRFTLWQRIGFGSDNCFKERILEVRHISMICQDRWQQKKIEN